MAASPGARNGPARSAMAESVFSPDSPAYLDAGKAQATAADPAHSAWVSANAGSGKTKVLIDRVARLLLKDAAPDSILCITYTRAAANEMISRLFRQLGAWSVMDDAELLAQLAALEGRAPESYAPEELPKARALFAKALETPGGLRIETIHAFCARLLRRFPLEARIPPGFREIEERDAERMWQEAVRAGVLQLDDARPEVIDALAAEGRGLGLGASLGLVRGAGTKLWLDPDEAAEQLRAELKAPDVSAEALLQKAMLADLPVTEYRAAIESLRAGTAKTDIALSDRLMALLECEDAAGRWDLVQGIWKTGSGSDRKTNPFTKAMAPQLEGLFAVTVPEGREITRLRAVDTAWRAARAVERTLALITLARPVLAAYDAAKGAHGALDFDDLITAANTLLTLSGQAAWVLYKLDGGISHVLLDEAQDTSPDQWTLVHALTEEFFSGMGSEKPQDPRTLFVVGDEKQSIYSFQGADPDKFHVHKQELVARTAGGLKTPDMLMSFRSSPEVLEFVDTVFDTDLFEGAPFSEFVPEEADRMRHEARRANQPGCVELWPVEEPAEPDPDDPWEPPVDAMGEDAPKARLARKIASEVRALIDRGESIWVENPDRSWSRKPAEAGDVLILVRKRKGGLFDALIQELKRQHLPVAGADRLTLKDHIGVQDLLNLIRFTLMPDDDLTLAEILRGPFCDLVDDDHHLFPLAYKRKRPLWGQLQAAEAPIFHEARTFLESVLERRAWPPFEFLSAVLDGPVKGVETGWDRIGARLGTPARDPVEALLSRALAHDGQAGASLQTFLSAMDRDASEIKRDLAESGGAVRVMTVHGAKGLQAPIVILPDTTSPPPGASGGLLSVNEIPVWAARKDEDTDRLSAARLEAELAAQREARRLLYVALTRAQDRLILCGAWFGSKTGAGYNPASWYGLCASAMERLAGPAEEGVDRQYFGAPPPCMAPAEAAVEEDAPAPAWLRQTAPKEAAGRRAISPSTLLRDDTPVIDPLAPRPPDRRLRGRLIHALLERLPRLDASEHEAAARAFLAREPALSETERNEICATTLATLGDPAMAEVFSPAGRAEAAIVGTGTGWPEGTLINGRVDRLIVRPERVLVVDIKTDRPPPADEHGVSEAYLMQMATYANVLEAGFPDRRVECALVWTQGPRLMPLSRARLLEALNRAQSGL